MGPSLAELLHDWHDFYVLVGTASATLVGLMFVAVSIGASIFNDEHSAGMTAFITPTVVHFAAVLFTCLLVTIPTQSWHTLGGLLGAGGLAGSIYCGRLVIQMIIRHRFNVDVIDRLFYALLPLLGYVLALISAALLLMQSTATANLIAAAVLVLLFAAIRNAWDMMVWIVIKAPPGGAPPSLPPSV
jgi:lipid-A-disaccharide synthase-like uncharacterized protein